MVAKTSILMTNYSVTWIVKVYGLCDFVLSKRKQQLGTKLFGTGCDNNFRLRGFITAVNMRSTDYWTVISETKTSAFWIGVKIIYRKESLYALALVTDDWQVFLTSNICWPWHITCLCSVTFTWSELACSTNQHPKSTVKKKSPQTLAHLVQFLQNCVFHVW